jgi:phage terminase small subunit
VIKLSRPSKSAKVLHSRSQTKDEVNTRIEVEEALKGNPEDIKPSNRLNSNQKKIFNYIVSELKATKILGNLDSYMLEMGVIAIDRIQCIEKDINRDFSKIYDKDLMAAKAKYSSEFFKFCQEACLSPQARAKMGVIASNKMMEEKDSLLKVLKGKSG